MGCQPQANDRSPYLPLTQDFAEWLPDDAFHLQIKERTRTSEEFKLERSHVHRLFGAVYFLGLVLRAVQGRSSP